MRQLCPSLNTCLFTTGAAKRNALTGAISAGVLKGQTVDTYIGFISADGKYVADSIYTGQVTVAA